MDIKDYVLGKFSVAEMEILSPVLELSSKILEDYLTISFDLLMNQYNMKNRGLK